MAEESIQINDLSFIKASCVKKNYLQFCNILFDAVKDAVKRGYINIYGINTENPLRLISAEYEHGTAYVSIIAPFKIQNSDKWKAAIVYSIEFIGDNFYHHKLSISSDYKIFYKERVSKDDVWKEHLTDPDEIEKVLSKLLSPILLWWIDK